MRNAKKFIVVNDGLREAWSYFSISFFSSFTSALVFSLPFCNVFSLYLTEREKSKEKEKKKQLMLKNF